MSEITSPDICSMFDTITPLSILLIIFTASVTVARATSMAFVGRVTAVLTTSENASTISWGRSLMIVGTSSCSISLTNFSASWASVSRVYMMLHGISLVYRTNLFDRRMPLSIALQSIINRFTVETKRIQSRCLTYRDNWMVYHIWLCLAATLV